MATEEWQKTMETLEKRNNHLMETNLYADCSFLVGTAPNEKTFEGHQLILVSASVVFERMFYGALAEKTSPIIITDVEPRIFKMMMNYVYTDAFDAQDISAAIRLYYVADKYMLPYLAETCSNYISTNLNIENCCKIFEFAKLYDISSLMDTSLEMISENTSEVIAESSFSDVQGSTLLTILDQNWLTVECETELFGGIVTFFGANVLKLANYDAKSLEENDEKYKVVREALKKIRFLTLTAEQFANCLAQANLLQPLESVAIFVNISNTTNSVFPMPKGWSTNRSPRND